MTRAAPQWPRAWGPRPTACELCGGGKRPAWANGYLVCAACRGQAARLPYGLPSGAAKIEEGRQPP